MVNIKDEMVDSETVIRMRDQSGIAADWLWDRLRKFRQATQAGISELSVSTDHDTNTQLLDALIDFSREMGAVRLSAVLEDILAGIRPGRLPRAEELSLLYETYARTYAKLVLLIFDKE